jgi:putative membrane protein
MTSANSQTTTVKWSGLSPWSIVSYIFNTIRQVLSNGYAIIPFVYTGWQKGFDSPWFIVGAGAVVTAVVTYAIVQWAMFRYRLFDDKLGVRHGLIFKKANEIPLSKIQNVRLEQPLYFRPMGLYSLVVETAGSKEDEAVLAAVSYQRAMEIKQHLVADIQPKTSASSTPTIPAESSSQPTTDDNGLPQENTLVTKGFSDLLLFGLYQNNLFWFSIIAGPILSQFDWSEVVQTDAAKSALDWYYLAVNDNLLYQMLLITSLIIGFYLLLSLISMAASVLKYYPYRLGLSGRTLHRSGGIIAKQNDALALYRVQVISFSQPVVGRLLKLWTINFKQVKGTEVEQKAKKHMLIPSMSRQQIAALMPSISDSRMTNTVLPTHYNPIHLTWFWRRASLPLIVPAVNTIGMGLNPTTEILWALGFAFTAGIYLRYRQWGYMFNNNTCWIHTGVLGQSWHRVSLKKVQHVAIIQTKGQRKRGLANLELGLASGNQTIPYMPIADARVIAERALAITANNNSNWI